MEVINPMENAGMIKLLICDVDGVLTNGKKIYDKDGNTFAKQFCDKDFTAIKQFKSIGVKVIWLSGDIFNKTIAANRKIEFYSSINKHGELDKLSTFINDIKSKFPDISLNEIAFIGDDIFDICIANYISNNGGYVFSPKDGNIEMNLLSFFPLKINGGDGVLSELFYELKRLKLINEYNINKVIQIDAKEKK